MNTRYKLTNQDLTTYYGFQWKLNEWKETSGEGKLCSSGWLHCYTNPLLAIFLNRIHAKIKKPKLFEIEVEGHTLTDKGLKEGWTRMRLVKELSLPEVSLTQRIAFGILCSMEVYKDKNYLTWCRNWLNGKDRSKASANDVAYDAAARYASAAALDAANHASNAAYHASNAAYAAALDAAYDASAYHADVAANYAADAAVNSANAYASAAYAANYAAANLDLVKIAEKAMEVK